MVTVRGGRSVPGSAIRYVALGDSRATGSLDDPLSLRDGCFRTSDGYPQIVADTLHVGSFVDRSCAGAKTENITEKPQFTITGPQSPQIDALAPDTTLVTVSIGGNDIAWSSLVEPCYTLIPGGDANCRSDATTRGASTPHSPHSARSVRHPGRDHREGSHRHGVPGGPRRHLRRPRLLAVHPHERRRRRMGRAVSLRMNDVLADAARTNGAHFVDVAGAREGTTRAPDPIDGGSKASFRNRSRCRCTRTIPD
ncbi:SGNH/GDSL hydrolase family protein [Rhodococcus opacus]|nr:SGNH/GDSL hydrolase family protein [Rhodococcus opacus]